MSEVLMVLSNLPDRASAEALAQHLVERRLAACVNILGSCRSVYRWEGKIERADEVPVMVKTTAARYTELEAAIRSHHPYEAPEIVALPVTQGLQRYLKWVHDETGEQP